MNKASIRVMMISTDRNILAPGSAVSKRVKEYGALVDELHIVLLCDKKHLDALKIENRKLKISDSVSVYPTNSLNKFFRPLDAVKVGKSLDFNLIVTQDPFECGWVGERLKRYKRVPLEVQLHTNPFSKEFNSFLNFVRKQIMRGVLKKADSIRVVSESLIQKLAASNSQLEAKTVVLPIYIDRERIEGEPKFDLHEKHGFKKVLLAVSRLTEEKNIGLALDAFRLVREKNKDAGLVIVGSGPFESELKLKARSYNLEASVVFAGWQGDLASYYKTADVFIQTSKFEGYGLSLVEAGLCGLPVVTTPVGIATELKNVTIANTRDEFARAIESEMIVKNESLKQELETKILKKEEYLSQLKNNWERLLQK